MSIFLAVTEVWGAEPLVTSTLEWQAPTGQGCPMADELARAVETRLRRRVFVAPERADVRLHGAIVPSAVAPWTVTLTLHDSHGRELGVREIRSQSKSCAALAETLPVVVALLIDLPRSRIQLDLPESEPAQARDALPQPVDAAWPSVPAPLAKPTPSSWSFGGALMGEAAFGLVPNWGWGMAMYFDVRPPDFPKWSVWVSQVGPVSSSPHSTDREGPGVLVSLRTAGLQLCPSLLRRAVLVEACGGVALGQAAARGVGYDETWTEGHLYSALHGGVRLGVPIFKSVAAGLNVMVEAPLWRNRIVGEETPGISTVLFRAEPLGGRIHFGLTLRPE